MQVRTNVRAAGATIQHAQAVTVRTGVKGGGWYNHAQAVIVKTGVGGGALGSLNHAQALAR